MCEQLPVIKNGEVLKGQTPFNIGHKLFYKCNNGYVIVGKLYLECISKNQWTDSNCQPISCGDPGHVENATRTNAPFTFPNFVRYECNEGYKKLPGIDTIFCMASGDWSNHTMKCVPIQCPPLTNPKNGTVNYSLLREYGSTAQYTCNRGYRLMSGDLERQCLENGEWSGEEPICRRRFDPPVVLTLPADLPNEIEIPYVVRSQAERPIQVDQPNVVESPVDPPNVVESPIKNSKRDIFTLIKNFFSNISWIIISVFIIFMIVIMLYLFKIS